MPQDAPRPPARYESAASGAIQRRGEPRIRRPRHSRRDAHGLAVDPDGAAGHVEPEAPVVSDAARIADERAAADAEQLHGRVGVRQFAGASSAIWTPASIPAREIAPRAAPSWTNVRASIGAACHPAAHGPLPGRARISWRGHGLERRTGVATPASGSSRPESLPRCGATARRPPVRERQAAPRASPESSLARERAEDGPRDERRRLERRRARAGASRRLRERSHEGPLLVRQREEEGVRPAAFLEPHHDPRIRFTARASPRSRPLRLRAPRARAPPSRAR